MKRNKTGVIAGGLALFSMFFGGGDLIWPLILGGRAGDHTLFTTLGLLISGVSLPLMGLISIMLFLGDIPSFFGRIGRIPGLLLVFIIQAIIGPIGALPRLITLAHATLSPYLPLNLLPFSLICCLIVFAFAARPNRLVDIFGVVLAPILLISMAVILTLGFIHHPTPIHVFTTPKHDFMQGLLGGYNTLDLIASFIFAPVVISYFRSKNEELHPSPEGTRSFFKKMVGASLIAGVLMSLMFFALSFVSSYYTPLLPPHDEAARLGLIAVHLIGPYGAFVACVSVALVCLTTAVPVAVISANYLQHDLSNNRMPRWLAIFIPMAVATCLANLGFMSIANMLSPVLQILCPGLIILCVLNILHKLYAMNTPRTPVYVAFGVSLITYLVLV